MRARSDAGVGFHAGLRVSCAYPAPSRSRRERPLPVSGACSAGCRAGLVVRLRRATTLDAHVGEPLEPARQVPVPVAEQFHGGRHDDRPHHGRVDEDGDREAEAHLLEHDHLARGHAAEHADHDRGRAGDDAGGAADAVAHGLARVAGLVVALLDAAEQEHLVVHREAEEQGEEHERHPGLDALHLGEAQETGADALLEDQHQQPVGGADAQEVHEDRLHRDDDRAEGHQQEHEAQAEDHQQHDRQPGVEEAEVVDDARRRTRHVHLGGAAGERGGDQVVAQVLHQRLRGLAHGVAGQRGGQQRQVAGLVGGGLDGREAAVLLHRLLEPADALLDGAVAHPAVHHDLQRVGLAEREVAVEHVPALLGVVAVGQVAGALGGAAAVHHEDRERRRPAAPRRRP